MGGIISNVGLFSGINSGQIIEQLMALESRPRVRLQQRVLALQQQSAAVLDINSRLDALRRSAQTFRIDQTFRRANAVSSNEQVLTAKASAGAGVGNYQFIVDRLVSTQQFLSRGFSDRGSSALGLTALTIESERAMLARDTSLADLNGGAGVERGRIVVTDSAGRSATVDLSRVATVGEVIEAINANGTAQVTAMVRNGRIVVRDNAGGNITIANASGSNTASSLGIAGTAVGQITGQDVYRLGSNTTLASLNDGTGVSIKNVVGENPSNFSIVVDNGGGPVTVAVNVGEVYQWEGTEPNRRLVLREGAVTTIGGVLARINAALDAAGLGSVRAEVDPDGRRLRIRDTAGTGTTISIVEGSDTTARDLGLTNVFSAGGVLTGRRIFAGLNSVLAGGLAGGAGIGGDGVLNFTTRDGTAFSLTLSNDQTIQEIMQAIEDAAGTLSGGGARLTVTLSPTGTGLRIRDNSTGSGNLTITGTPGDDTAEALGISTGPAGTTADTVTSGNLQLRYLSRATLLADLNNGRGIGTGRFTIRDSRGADRTVNISDSIRTVGQLIDQINAASPDTLARINANGDGIEIVENLSGGGQGPSKIRVSDLSGSVARLLNLAGEAAGLGAENRLNGSYERTITFSAGDTLQQVVDRINQAAAGVSAAIVNDGTGSTPFRMSLTSAGSGRAGRMIIDAGGFDLGLRLLDEGRDARVFLGSSDPARAVLLTSSSNTLDGVIAGVRIDLRGVSAAPVSLAVAADTARMEKDVEDFIKAFNDLVDRITTQTRYVEGATRQAALVGDGTVIALRGALFATLQARNLGMGGRFDELADVGIEIAQGGRLRFDKDRFRAALAEDPAAVEQLFTVRTLDPVNGTIRAGGETFSALSVMAQIEQFAKGYVDTNEGILTLRTRSIEEQIRAQNARIAAIDARLESRRDVLTRQFARMEQAIAQLQRQQSALSSIVIKR